MAKPRIKTGISSILFYRGLRDKDAENMLNGNGFTPTSTDPRTNSYEYENSRYEGIVLTVDKINGSPWILYVNVAPTEVLQESGPYQPSEGSYEKLTNAVDTVFAKVKSPYRLRDLKLSEVAVTADVELSKEQKVDQYYSVIHQAFVPHQYMEDQYPAEVPDNYFVYCQRSETTSFYAHAWRDSTLRLQLDLCYRAILRKVGEETLKSHYKTLVQLSRQINKMMVNHLKRMKLLSDSYVSYDKAVKAIDGVKNKDTRKQMKYLLKKTRDLGSLLWGIDKLKKHYGLSKKQANRVIKRFTKLGISPATVQKGKKKRLPGLGVLLKNNIKK